MIVICNCMIMLIDYDGAIMNTVLGEEIRRGTRNEFGTWKREMKRKTSELRGELVRIGEESAKNRAIS